MAASCGVAANLVYKRVHVARLRLASCSPQSPELQWQRATKNLPLLQNTGAGERNRTVVISLEGFSSTIELHPQIRNFPPHYACCLKLLFYLPTKSWWRGLDSNQRTRKRADLQSAAINHSATSPRNPTLSRIFGKTSNIT